MILLMCEIEIVMRRRNRFCFFFLIFFFSFPGAGNQCNSLEYFKYPISGKDRFEGAWFTIDQMLDTRYVSNRQFFSFFLRFSSASLLHHSHIAALSSL
jgi:hypothetical protein